MLIIEKNTNINRLKISFRNNLHHILNLIDNSNLFKCIKIINFYNIILNE